MRFLYLPLILFLSLSTVFAQQKPVVCGTSDDALPKVILDKMAMLPTILQEQQARTGAGEMNVCRIAVEIDYQTYVQFEKDTNLIYRQVHEDIQKVSEVYEREINTRMVVTGIRIFKNPDTDPFGSTYDIFQIIGILEAMAPVNPDFDKKAYLFTKTLIGAGGVANLNGKASVSPLGNPQVAMHEFGHNFASLHTHNCNWPGGPIDFCVNAEGDCYDKALETLQDRSGTLMSYCTKQSTFHPLCQAIMRDHADQLFSKIRSIPATPALSANAQVAPGDFLFWQPSPTALSYEVTYAPSADFSNSKTASVAFNGFQVRGVGVANTLFVKIRAVNTFGASSWSQPVTVSTGSGKLPPPEINVPATPPIFPMGTVVKLSYAAVPGATSYEIQIGNPTDASFENPYLKIVSTTSEAQYTANLPTMLKWRVRAVNAQGQSKWSESGFFSVNPSRTFPLSIPFYQNAPTTFPFAYSPPSSRVKVRVSIADNHDFSDAVFMKEYDHIGPVTDVVSNLPPNTNLFFKLEEWNESDNGYPKTKTIDYTFSFSTANTTLPAGLTFLSPLAPDVFNYAYPKIALTSKNVWMASRTKGFVRVDQKDFRYQAFNRGNTDGLLGSMDLPAPFQVDDSLNIEFTSFRNISSFVRTKFRDDEPSNPTPLSPLNFTGGIAGYNPSHRLYWSNSVVYKEINNTLAPLKSFPGDWFIRKVVVMSGKAWILAANYKGQAEITVIDPVSGSDIERINSSTHPELLLGMDSFALSPDGKIMILQYDPIAMGNRVSLWDKQKWTVLDGRDPLVSGGAIRSIASSPSGELYTMVWGLQTRILKYNGSEWEKTGEDIPLLEFATSMDIDASDNIWLTGIYGLAKLAQIVPEPITGIAEPSLPKVSVYPNPSSDRILIQYAEHNSKPDSYHIADIRGNILASKQVREKLTEWDISNLGAGIYVLWTVHNGHKRSWKIVKD
ncbi:hypothetical protein J2Y45_004828 [Dyadobacter sp. BE34]|uniref:Fibronectin type-III domain-containing protein n=1 Tax=Dyadobacter fermentans TaxID=94254 RepID=A0ABU1R2K9_9BACT|nr:MULTISPECIES: M12 family metallo-peptidase [Dyadobacter]MDR6807628.1 hypothetical protein [Dyadobacter fermentans]MDR7045369.1 hypothetical protein [Dyadobacter sp. BE242]MDR7199682.1 hypothetical protein [Dyadobacter sp. BE34]MDR7217859.1 hypothetical protein [Dyadobacter sp. BE31]MDR7265573.1 hypothetical protein [Dyadobacter sp. BE32]